MYRYTTPTLKFNMHMDTNNVSQCYITFMQNNLLVLEKELKDIVKDNEFLKLTLTQEETALFGNGEANLQIRYKIENKAFATKEITLNIYRVFKEGVI